MEFVLIDRDLQLDERIAEAHAIVAEAIATYFYGAKRINQREVAGIIGLFSGGNDSTVMAHLFRDTVTHYGHANTGIGVEETRQFVRDTCAAWGKPLLERHPPAGSTYREMVIEEGFPGPSKHWKMYQRLKLRAVEQMQRELITNPYRQRLILLAGRRVGESPRRTQRAVRHALPRHERRKSVVWVSPLVNWSALDMNTYRMRFPDCPLNEVHAKLHMSGECLCGAFAEPDELDQIRFWFPDLADEIDALAAEVAAAGNAEPERCRWGWGAHRDRSKVRLGPMCSGCEQGTIFDLEDA